MEKINLLSLLRNDIDNLEEYMPGETAIELVSRYRVTMEKLVKLNANENPYGPSPLAKKAARNAFFQYYPSSEYKELRRLLAKYNKVDAKQIVVGSGSDEIIDLLLRLTLDKGEKVIIAPPTFGMYEAFTKLNGGLVISIPRNRDYSLNVKEIFRRINKEVKIIFLCNPNNPTGILAPLVEIEMLLQSKKLVVVDEAYFEFSKQTALPLLKKYNNLIILRTLSKWAGLAGLRIGYAIMNGLLALKIKKLMPPFTVNVAAERAAIATLEDLSFAQKTIAKIISERERMYEELSLMPSIHTYQSYGNYVFLKVNNKVAYQKMKNAFEENKIALRYYDAPLTPKGVRITIGKPKQNNKVIKIIKGVMNT